MSRERSRCGRCNEDRPHFSYESAHNNGWDGLAAVRTPICLDCCVAIYLRVVRVSELETRIRARRRESLLQKFLDLRPRLLEEEELLAKIEAKVAESEAVAA